MLGTLFFSQDEINKSKLIVKERETEKDRELKILENIFHKRLSSDHISKMSELMYTRGDPLYAKKRCNIKDTKITLNNNNDFYLTFKTLYKVRKGYSTNVPSPSVHFHSQTESLPKITNTHTHTHTHTHTVTEDNNNINDDNNSMTDEEKKEIFEQLQTRHKFYYDCHDKYSPYYHYQHQQHSIPTHISRNPTLSTEHYHTLSTATNNNNNLLTTKLTAFPQSNYSLRKTILTNLGLYDDVERIREKHGILKKIHCDNNNKPRLMSIELFNCDKERWNQKYNSSNTNKETCNTTNREYKGIIHKMKGEAIQCKGINAECKEIYEELKNERKSKERRTSRLGKPDNSTLDKRVKRRSKIKLI